MRTACLALVGCFAACHPRAAPGPDGVPRSTTTAPPAATQSQTPPEPIATAPLHAEPFATPPTRAPELAVAVVPTDVPSSAALLQWPQDMHLSAGTSVVLYDDEKQALRRAVAKLLARRGVTLVPLERLERIEDAAQAGRLALEGDLQCVTPPSRDEIHLRDFPSNPRVTIEAGCLDGCALTVVVDVTGENPQYLTSAPVKRPERASSWIAAVATLGDQATGFGGLGIGGTSHVPPMRFETPGTIGAWAPTTTFETLDVMFDGLEEMATPCAVADPLIGLWWELRLQVDASGRTSRCAATSSSPDATPAAARCLCDVMSNARFGKGSRERRLRLDAVDDGGFGSGDLAFVQRQPGTEPWIERLRGSPAAARCAQTLPPPSPLDATLSLTLTPGGRIDDVRIDGDFREIAAMQWAQCMVAGLSTLQLPCAPPGIEILRVGLRVPSR
ncbi:MAG: hypothetical protein K1X88_19500 [Nannocystaceae bacterium]|nr:hypothetical protein [Nannocystaceae bacterium]